MRVEISPTMEAGGKGYRKLAEILGLKKPRHRLPRRETTRRKCYPTDDTGKSLIAGFR
jgi:hypothetical protein